MLVVYGLLHAGAPCGDPFKLYGRRKDTIEWMNQVSVTYFLWTIGEREIEV